MIAQIIDLEQPEVLKSVKNAESESAEGDIENLELYRLHNNEIIQLMQMGYSLRAALLCIQITKSSDIQVITNFALMNEHGKYTHPFLEEGKEKLCFICNDVQSKHSIEADREFFKKIPIKSNLYNILNNFLRRIKHIGTNSKSRFDKIGPKLTTNLNIAPKSERLISNKKAPIKNIQPKMGTPKSISKAIKDPVTCTVCYEEVERENIVKYDDTPHDICKPCFIEYLTTQINHNQVTKIICPHCSQDLQDAAIKQIVPNKLYEKYHKFLNNIKVNSDPLCKWCPNPKCSEVITLEKGNAKKGKCEHCGLKICDKCGQKYHGTSTSCEQYMTSEIKKWKLGHDSAQCPNCKMIVQKIDGCNHMTCPVCLYQWCWLCGTIYTKLHYSNPFGCMGLQNGGNTKKKWGRLKLYLRRFFFLLTLPLLLIFGIPCHLSLKVLKKCKREPCESGLLFIPVFLLGLVLSALFIVFLPLILPYYLIRYCHDVRRIRRRTRHPQN